MLSFPRMRMDSSQTVLQFFLSAVQEYALLKLGRAFLVVNKRRPFFTTETKRVTETERAEKLDLRCLNSLYKQLSALCSSTRGR